ncbi:MAG: hypothetical protein AB7O26_03865, partial [Planctomycetaceae bacterium]
MRPIGFQSQTPLAPSGPRCGGVLRFLFGIVILLFGVDSAFAFPAETADEENLESLDAAREIPK